jgi:glycosyltransferase involved in cell wall biosynthesis
MRILIMLTYYRPHTSGLTIYAERIARAFAARGNEVTVLTTQFQKDTALDEWVDGVHIVRVPVLFRISKGVIAPTIGMMAWKLVKESDVVHLHLPQFDAAGVALRGWFLNIPSVITYHCDLQMPSGLFNQVANQVIHIANRLAGLCTDRIITYTQDYADHSPYMQAFKDKIGIIQPPVVLPVGQADAAAQFAQKFELNGKHPVIAMAARFAAEKGVEVLLDAMPRILSEFPDAQVLFAGQYENVLGEDKYAARLFPRINQYIAEGHWKWLGVVGQADMSGFYQNLDVLTVPSLNSTESFGLVQIEAMMNNVPVVASDLPGVRQPVKMSGMGEIFPIGDANGLAEQICKVLHDRSEYHVDHEWLVNHFSPDTVAAEYEKLFTKLIAAHQK